MGKEYYAEVIVEWGTSFDADNKEDFIEKLKDQFKNNYNINLKDDEISVIQRVFNRGMRVADE